MDELQGPHSKLWEYNENIGLLGLLDAYKHGCKNQHEIANYLNVTDEYLKECIYCYKDKYGVCEELDNYVIYFIPNLIIFEKLES